MTELQRETKTLTFEELVKEVEDMRTFFATLTVIKLPLTVKGSPAIILECLVSNDVSDKIKELINPKPEEEAKPEEQKPEEQKPEEPKPEEPKE
jgi:hypothetical protein